MSLHRPLSQIDSLVIHCAATPNGRWTTVEDIDRWHGPDREARGLRPFLRRSGSPYQMPHLKHIGYHFVIYTNGAVAGGRGLTETGAHAIDRRAIKGSEASRRYNNNAIATCLVGTDRFSQAQWDMLAAHVQSLLKRFPDLEVIGHRDIDPGKVCPGFDVAGWLARGMKPLPDHILDPKQKEIP